jgi:hypothetical protein
MSLADLSGEFELGEALKTVVQSLQLTTLLPATLLVASIVLFFFPSPDELKGTTVGLLVFAVITLSFLLHALNMPIIRLWEGYILGNTRLVQKLREGQLDHFDELSNTAKLYKSRVQEIGKELEELEERLVDDPDDEEVRELERWKNEWADRRRELLERLEDRFPPSRQYVLPTSMGNTIAAFERYPFERYRMDPIQLWTRFVPLLAARNYAVFVQNEKAILDFLINLLSVSVLIFAESLLKFGISGDPVALATAISIIGASFILYKAAVVAAANWGTTFKAAFDLYRHDLRSQLYLHLPRSSLEGERAMWQGVSDFFAFNNTRTFQGFDYASVPSSQQEKQKLSTVHSHQEINRED